MNVPKIFSNRETAISAPHAPKSCATAVLVLLLGVSCGPISSQAQQPDNDPPGAQVLTRGPVHEAFAGMVTFNPEPGVIVTKAPPAIIEELPPEERPEGDNVSWIPGYWGWDDERNDFLWVSGTWRALPPGREWLAGYWAQTPRGYQWTSGYWADATVRETTYLPPPPMTVEVGPNIAAPSADYGWTPGCWIWYEGRYAWRPGYWAQCRADWDWIPSHYIYTPRGCLFVGGFWDYPVARRGIVFAPVYFQSGVYARSGYSYSPSIVISLGVFSDHLFLRPSYSHYYFGDYYAPSYSHGGFYASFSFQSSHYGYDSFYSHDRWEHRGDHEWEHRVETSYQYRRDHEDARPPRTWTAQKSISPNTAESGQNRMLVAAPIEQVTKRKDSPVRFQPVAKEERQKLAARGQEVQQSREQRRTLEAKATVPTIQKPGEVIQPSKAELPRSPIMSKPVNQLAKDHTPPPAQQSPKPDLQRQPKSEPPGRQQKAAPGNSQSQPQARPSESEKKSSPGQNKPTAPEPQPQPKPDRPPEQTQPQSPVAPQPVATGSAKPVQPATRPPAQSTVVTTTEDSQRNSRGQEQKAHAEAQARQDDTAAKAHAAAQQNANATAAKARQESERQANAAAVADNSQQKARAMEKQAQAVSTPHVTATAPQAQHVATQPGKPKADTGEKGATKLLNNDHQKKAKGKPTPPDYPPAPPPVSQ